MKKYLLLSTAAALVSATAQTTAYPDGAATLAPETLTEALAGKSFTAAPAQGPVWRLQFNANGYYFLNAGSYSDSGKWIIKESSLCLESPKNSSCNEMRQKDNVLHLKRDSGEIVAFQPK